MSESTRAPLPKDKPEDLSEEDAVRRWLECPADEDIDSSYVGEKARALREMARTMGLMGGVIPRKV